MDMPSLILSCSLVIDPMIATAIIRTESSEQKYAVNVNIANRNNLSEVFDNAEEAINFSSEMVALGHTVDMGLGQINSNNLESLNQTIDQIFEPCSNLQAMQEIFLRSYNLKNDEGLSYKEKIQAALSRYNTGNPISGIDNGYVDKVIDAMNTFISEEHTYVTSVKPISDEKINNNSDGYRDSDSLNDGYSINE